MREIKNRRLIWSEAMPSAPVNQSRRTHGIAKGLRVAIVPWSIALGTLAPVNALAGCSYTGFCGTIAFLGWTADRTQAIFLSKTVQAGDYVVQPTVGITTNIDSWTTTGPTERISVSPRAAPYGGTHILYSMNGGQAFVDSAYQGGSSQVFPNNYRSPDSIPHSTVTHVVVNTLPAATGVTFNEVLPPVIQTPREEIVAIQQVQIPKPLLPPVLSAEFSPATSHSPSSAGGVVRIQAEPAVPRIDRSPAQEAIRVPTAQQVEFQSVTPVPVQVPPQPAFQSQQDVVLATPSPHLSARASSDVFVEKQTNPGAIQATATTSETLAPAGNGVKIPSQAELTTNTPDKPLANVTNAPDQQGDRASEQENGMLPCLRNPTDRRCVTYRQVNSPAFATWIDTRAQRISDIRGGLNQYSTRAITSIGVDRLERSRVAFGVGLGRENEKGSMLNRFVHFETTEYSLNPHLSYRISPTWVAIAGAGYKKEKTTATILSLKGSYVADHYSALLGSVGHFNMAGQWLSPSFFYNRNRIQSREGAIQGVVAGTNVDLVTSATRQDTEALSAGLEWGTTMPLTAGLRWTFQAKAITHYDLSPAQTKPWSGDIRIGARAYFDRMTTLELGVSKLGVGRTGLDIQEVRVALVHGF